MGCQSAIRARIDRLYVNLPPMDLMDAKPAVVVSHNLFDDRRLSDHAAVVAKLHGAAHRNWLRPAEHVFEEWLGDEAYDLALYRTAWKAFTRWCAMRLMPQALRRPATV